MRDYQKYLSEVLGIHEVLIADGKEAAPAVTGTHFLSKKGAFEFPQDANFELVFLNILSQSKESLFLPEVEDLFGKMKAAMRLKNIQVLELDVTLEDRSLLPSEFLKHCRARMIVVFSSFPKDIGEIIIKGSSRWLETYSPSYLIEDAGAKKVVWNDLQKVMKELSL
ncbi:hypothetical protein BDW_08570 [Bdellovibrio bacteriovorus W]|nr:hypothetical protein BDW_08570 [Bdellovibrio bacteriovorus W]